jgi:hypothetical protein
MIQPSLATSKETKINQIKALPRMVLLNLTLCDRLTGKHKFNVNYTPQKCKWLLIEKR